MRSVGYYIIQIYIPAILIVVISWIAFWLDRLDTNTRVALGMTTVLTITTLIATTNASLPKISYIKALDVFLVFCFFMVFTALMGNNIRVLRIPHYLTSTTKFTFRGIHCKISDQMDWKEEEAETWEAQKWDSVGRERLFRRWLGKWISSGGGETLEEEALHISSRFG